MMNLNTFAKEVTLSEGKKKQISIAQVKEVMKLVFQRLNKESDKTILTTIRRYK